MASGEGITACLHLPQYDGHHGRLLSMQQDGVDVACSGLQGKNTVMNVFSDRLKI